MKSLRDLVELSQSRSGPLTWAATPGLPYFAFAGLLDSRSIDMTYVPYRDFGPAIADLHEGRIDVVCTALTQLLPHHQAEKIRVIAVINRNRSAIAPDIPTAAEGGYPELTFDGVTGFFGWRGMPVTLRDRIAADVRAVAAMPSIADRLKSNGIRPRGSTADEFAAAIDAQRSTVSKIAAAIGTEPQ